MKKGKYTISKFNNEFYLHSQHFLKNLIEKCNEITHKRFLNLINEFYLQNQPMKNNRIDMCFISTKSTFTVREKIESGFLLFSFLSAKLIMTTQVHCILTEFAASLSIGGKNTKR